MSAVTRQALAKRIRTAEQDAFVSLQKAADLLLAEVAELLKQFGLTTTQYNALRILRTAADGEGLACNEIGLRLINRDPDITRLLDRMEASKLVSRSRDRNDRRIITTRITLSGLKLLDALDKPVQELHERQMGRLSRAQLESLLQSLDQLRERPAHANP